MKRYLILALLLFALPAHAIGPMAIPTSGRAPYTIQTTINGQTGTTSGTGIESDIQFYGASPGIQVDYFGPGDTVAIVLDGSTCASGTSTETTQTLACNTTTHTGTLAVTVDGTESTANNFRVKVQP